MVHRITQTENTRSQTIAHGEKKIHRSPSRVVRTHVEEREKRKNEAPAMMVGKS